ncbi:MAG: CopG family ribbon-helix-helix protein [Tepidisphaeraceae bacterium]
MAGEEVVIVPRYNGGYTKSMKTAISIPDALYQKIDRFAKKKKLSRSEFFARAAEKYLLTQSKAELLAELNRTAEFMDEKLEMSMHEVALETLREVEW